MFHARTVMRSCSERPTDVLVSLHMFYYSILTYTQCLLRYIVFICISMRCVIDSMNYIVWSDLIWFNKWQLIKWLLWKDLSNLIRYAVVLNFSYVLRYSQWHSSCWVWPTKTVAHPSPDSVSFPTRTSFYSALCLLTLSRRQWPSSSPCCAALKCVSWNHICTAVVAHTTVLVIRRQVSCL